MPDTLDRVAVAVGDAGEAGLGRHARAHGAFADRVQQVVLDDLLVATPQLTPTQRGRAMIFADMLRAVMQPDGRQRFLGHPADVALEAEQEVQRGFFRPGTIDWNDFPFRIVAPAGYSPTPTASPTWLQGGSLSAPTIVMTSMPALRRSELVWMLRS